ncbi:hypothetical protein J132_04261 [Termitomyces sp. J132]|nr:hypothetical protein J132_04261 [Termitomyces sp. J132]
MTILSTSYHANNDNAPHSILSHSSAHVQFSSSPISSYALSEHLPLSPASGPTPGFPTTPALDMKRLLAKPAPPYVHTHGHAKGSGSESEGFSDNSQRKLSLVDHGAVLPKVGRSRSLQSLLDHRKEREMNANATATAPKKDKMKHKEKRPRNVLRRRPSTSTQSHTAKSSPVLPTTTMTTAKATVFPRNSPPPPLTPRSPLTPPMFPAMFSSGSPASNTSSPLGSTPCPMTTPSSSPRSGVYSTRPVSSFNKPLPPPPPDEENVLDRPSGSGLAQLRHVVEEYVVNVTDEKGKHVDPRARLRELKGHPCPSSSSSSPSRSHPSSPYLYHHPHHLSAVSLNGRSSRSRSRSRNTQPTDSDPSTILTPAAAVVAAYKQQEFQCEVSIIERSSIDVTTNVNEFGELNRGKKAKKRPHTSSGHERSATEPRPQMSAPQPKIQNVELDGKHQPYYTVFGTDSDRVVAAGGPQDRHHLSWEIVPPFTLTHKGSIGGGGGGLRTLTRKVSGHFKRAGNGTQSEEEERRRVSLSVERERERGRASFHEKSRMRAVLGKGEKGGLSLRLSIDKLSEVKAFKADREGKEKDTTPTSATKSPGSGPSTPSPNSGSGSKLWKLMKKISTGGLREKFVHDEVPPPVPSLPKEYAVPDPTRAFEIKTEASTALPLAEGLGQAVRKKASNILGVKMTSHPGSPIIKPSIPSSPLVTQVPIPSVRPSSSAPRPSTTTCSSSPVSSDVASSRFFACYNPSSLSAHSSTSSLPIEDSTYIPPLPRSFFAINDGVGQHIVPPSELGNIHVQSDAGHETGGSEPLSVLSSPRNPNTPSRSHMKLRVVVPSVPSSPIKTPREGDDYVITHTPAPEMVSLPLPPRRPGAPLGRMRRDTYTSITPQAGWGNHEEQSGDHETDNEDMNEWERIWGGSSSLRTDLDDIDEKILDSRSGSPMIPSFSTEDPINIFPSKCPSTISKRSNFKPSPFISTATSPSIMRPSPSRSHLNVMGEIDIPAESLFPPPRPARNPQRPASTPTQPSQTLAFVLDSDRHMD